MPEELKQEALKFIASYKDPSGYSEDLLALLTEAVMMAEDEHFKVAVAALYLAVVEDARP